MPKPNIVSTSFSEEATLDEGLAPEGWVRRLLVWLGVKDRLPHLTRSLFQHNMGAYRFVTDDGRSAIVPVSMEMVRDSAIDIEEMARETAIERLEALHA